jgi:hypothetical protein
MLINDAGQETGLLPPGLAAMLRCTEQLRVECQASPTAEYSGGNSDLRGTVGRFLLGRIAVDDGRCYIGGSSLIGGSDSCAFPSDGYDSFTISSPANKWRIFLESIFAGSFCPQKRKNGPVFYKMPVLGSDVTLFTKDSWVHSAR